MKTMILSVVVAETMSAVRCALEAGKPVGSHGIVLLRMICASDQPHLLGEWLEVMPLECETALVREWHPATLVAMTQVAPDMGEENVAGVLMHPSALVSLRRMVRSVKGVWWWTKGA